MNGEFVRDDDRIKEKTNLEKEMDLVRNIVMVNEQLNEANNNFEFAEDELADYYTYQIKANQAKLNYLIKQAKTKGITSDMINQIKISLVDKEQDAG